MRKSYKTLYEKAALQLKLLKLKYEGNLKLLEQQKQFERQNGNIIDYWKTQAKYYQERVKHLEIQLNLPSIDELNTIVSNEINYNTIENRQALTLGLAFNLASEFKDQFNDEQKKIYEVLIKSIDEINEINAGKQP